MRLWIVSLFVAVLLLSCLNVYAANEEGPLYTAHNIWYEPGKEKGILFLNYKTGIMIPAGTEVRNVKFEKMVRSSSKSKYKPVYESSGEPDYVEFETAEDGRRYRVRFVKKYHPGKTIYDYKGYMFTAKNFEELIEGFTEKELKGIKDGKVLIGMSKWAILISYGYPPEHRTPNLDLNAWIYWKNRYVTKRFHFDDDERAYKPVRDPDEL